ncbi:hypothetical protein [Filobacillus milosensis]|uniref:hypothetical protein n=1 Tax=Filobacillus milosensis TaxID=94137 RepID=UPI001E2FA865|nr:hypothetical protein [Filobacillus milosensis]
MKNEHNSLPNHDEDKQAAKEIAHAVLFHTESALPQGSFVRSPLQEVVHLADERDKQPGDAHHYRDMDKQEELRLIRNIDAQLDEIFQEQMTS